MRMNRYVDNTRLVMDDTQQQQQQLNHQNGSSIGGGQLAGSVGGGGGVGGGGVNSNNTGLNNKQGDENQSNQSKGPQYTMPGVLHYIQHEFSRFEIERSQWDVDRAELQVHLQYLLHTHTPFFLCLYHFVQ